MAMEVTLDEMIAEVERELALRRRLYPLWVETNRMSQTAANWQILAIQAVLLRLQSDRAKDEPWQSPGP